MMYIYSMFKLSAWNGPNRNCSFWLFATSNHALHHHHLLFTEYSPDSRIFDPFPLTARAMGHEISGANSYFRCAIPGLHLALQALIDYKGHTTNLISLFIYYSLYLLHSLVMVSCCRLRISVMFYIFLIFLDRLQSFSQHWFVSHCVEQPRRELFVVQCTALCKIEYLDSASQLCRFIEQRCSHYKDVNSMNHILITGFRMHAQAQLPINLSTLVVGTADAARSVHCRYTT